MLIVNTSYHRLTVQALALEPDVYRDAIPSLTHGDAPARAFDGPAQIIDVYTCLSEQEGRQYVTTALKPFSIEDLSSLPQETILDDQVLYEIHALAAPDLHDHVLTYSYQFRVHTRFKTQDRILQSFLGMIQEGEDTSQTFGQVYTVTRVNHQYRGKGRKTVLGTGMVSVEEFGICDLEDGHRACVGQLDKDIDIDIPTVFFTKDSPLSGNHSLSLLHRPILVLQIPLSLFGGEHNIDGMYATKRSLNWKRQQLNPVSPLADSR